MSEIFIRIKRESIEKENINLKSLEETIKKYKSLR